MDGMLCKMFLKYLKIEVPHVYIGSPLSLSPLTSFCVFLPALLTLRVAQATNARQLRRSSFLCEFIWVVATVAKYIYHFFPWCCCYFPQRQPIQTRPLFTVCTHSFFLLTWGFTRALNVCHYGQLTKAYENILFDPLGKQWNISEKNASLDTHCQPILAYTSSKTLTQKLSDVVWGGGGKCWNVFHSAI